MSVLVGEELLGAIDKGEIKIEPLYKKNIGPGSVDLTLGHIFRVFNQMHEIYDVNDEADYKKITRLIKSDAIVINPQETVLGITEEIITLAPNICGWLEGRSRFARLGLMIHISASFMQPGISNRQVLEISNNGHVPIRLHSGTRVCQFIFERTEGSAQYKGEFMHQREP